MLRGFDHVERRHGPEFFRREPKEPFRRSIGGHQHHGVRMEKKHGNGAFLEQLLERPLASLGPHPAFALGGAVPLHRDKMFALALRIENWRDLQIDPVTPAILSLIEQLGLDRFATVNGSGDPLPLTDRGVLALQHPWRSTNSLGHAVARQSFKSRIGVDDWQISPSVRRGPGHQHRIARGLDDATEQIDPGFPMPTTQDHVHKRAQPENILSNTFQVPVQGVETHNKGQVGVLAAERGADECLQAVIGARSAVIAMTSAGLPKVMSNDLPPREDRVAHPGAIEVHQGGESIAECRRITGAPLSTRHQPQLRPTIRSTPDIANCRPKPVADRLGENGKRGAMAGRAAKGFDEIVHHGHDPIFDDPPLRNSLAIQD